MTRVYEAVKALALCHNVTPVLDECENGDVKETEGGHIELKETGGQYGIVYQASSPDEVRTLENTLLQEINES